MGVLGVFYTLKTRASVMEHSIDLISTVLTESDLIQGKIRGRASSALPDDQMGH